MTYPPPDESLASPTLSVVLLSAGSLAVLHHALAVTLEPLASIGAEIIVARSCAAAEVALLRAAYPEVAFVDGGVEASSTELRVRGMTIARGDIVVLRADHEVGEGRWLQAFVEPRPSRTSVVTEMRRPMGVHAEPSPLPSPRPSTSSPRATDAPLASDR